MLNYPKHDNGKRDNRYQVNYEHLGYTVPMLAVRFCDDLIGVCRDELKANVVMTTHNKERF